MTQPMEAREENRNWYSLGFYAAQRKSAEAEWRKAIVGLRANGYTLVSIAERARVSPGRIWQILREGTHEDA